MTLREELEKLRRQIGEERDARERRPTVGVPQSARRTSDMRKSVPSKFPNPQPEASPS